MVFHYPKSPGGVSKNWRKKICVKRAVGARPLRMGQIGRSGGFYGPGYWPDSRASLPVIRVAPNPEVLETSVMMTVALGRKHSYASVTNVAVVGLRAAAS
jgi:hypothetical protein